MHATGRRLNAHESQLLAVLQAKLQTAAAPSASAPGHAHPQTKTTKTPTTTTASAETKIKPANKNDDGDEIADDQDQDQDQQSFVMEKTLVKENAVPEQQQQQQQKSDNNNNESLMRYSTPNLLLTSNFEHILRQRQGDLSVSVSALPLEFISFPLILLLFLSCWSLRVGHFVLVHSFICSPNFSCEQEISRWKTRQERTRKWTHRQQCQFRREQQQQMHYNFNHQTTMRATETILH